MRFGPSHAGGSRWDLSTQSCDLSRDLSRVICRPSRQRGANSRAIAKSITEPMGIGSGTCGARNFKHLREHGDVDPSRVDIDYGLCDRPGANSAFRPSVACHFITVGRWRILCFFPAPSTRGVRSLLLRFTRPARLAVLLLVTWLGYAPASAVAQPSLPPPDPLAKQSRRFSPVSPSAPTGSTGSDEMTIEQEHTRCLGLDDDNARLRCLQVLHKRTRIHAKVVRSLAHAHGAADNLEKQASFLAKLFLLDPAAALPQDLEIFEDLTVQLAQSGGPPLSSVQVQATPVDARIEIIVQGKQPQSVGFTPLLHWLPLGNHQIRFEHEGCVPVTKSIRLSPRSGAEISSPVKVHADLHCPADDICLLVTSEPEGATLWSEASESLGTTPTLLWRRSDAPAIAGRATATGHEQSRFSEEGAVSDPSSRCFHHHLALSPKPAHLRGHINPPSATIRINDATHSLAQLTAGVPLRPGAHTVVLEAEDHQPVVGVFTLPAAGEGVLAYTLRPRTPPLKSLLLGTAAAGLLCGLVVSAAAITLGNDAKDVNDYQMVHKSWQGSTACLVASGAAAAGIWLVDNGSGPRQLDIEILPHSEVE